MYPGFDEVRSEKEKLKELGEQNDDISANPSLAPFRAALGNTPCIAGGGYNWTNCWEGIENVCATFPHLTSFSMLTSYEQGNHDAIAFGRYFCSNGDLVHKLRMQQPFFRYGMHIY